MGVFLMGIDGVGGEQKFTEKSSKGVRGCSHNAEERLRYSCGRELNLGFGRLWLCSHKVMSVRRSQGLAMGLVIRSSLKYAVGK